jgi:hypothetical protein
MDDLRRIPVTDYQRGLMRAEQILLQMASSAGGAERCAYLDAFAAIRTEAEKVAAEKRSEGK